MNPLLLLLLALLAPVAGRVVAASAGPRMRRGRRTLGVLWHLALVALWSAAALRSGLGAHPTEGLSWGRALTVLLCGAAWVEAVSMARIEDWWRHRSRAPAAHSVITTDHRDSDAYRTGERTAVHPGAGGEVESFHTARAATSDETADTEDPLPPQAEALLRRILRLDRTPVDWIMTPRSQIVFVDRSVSLAAALERMRGTGHSRLPAVVSGSLDRIQGVVHAKDLVPLILDHGPEATVRPPVRRCLRIARGESVARVLEDFRRGRVHVGVVADSMGRTLGLVTLADVFLHLMGGRGGPAHDPEETPT